MVKQYSTQWLAQQSHCKQYRWRSKEVRFQLMQIQLMEIVLKAKSKQVLYYNSGFYSFFVSRQECICTIFLEASFPGAV